MERAKSEHSSSLLYGVPELCQFARPIMRGRAGIVTAIRACGHPGGSVAKGMATAEVTERHACKAARTGITAFAITDLIRRNSSRDAMPPTQLVPEVNKELQERSRTGAT